MIESGDYMNNDLHVVYSKKHIVIYQLGHGSYLVHNTRKDIGTGSTSIKKLSIAKDVLNWALYQKIPTRNISPYILRGLIRISDSKEYTKQINEIIKSSNIRVSDIQHT